MTNACLIAFLLFPSYSLSPLSLWLSVSKSLILQLLSRSLFGNATKKERKKKKTLGKRGIKSCHFAKGSFNWDPWEKSSSRFCKFSLLFMEAMSSNLMPNREMGCSYADLKKKGQYVIS